MQRYCRFMINTAVRFCNRSKAPEPVFIDTDADFRDAMTVGKAIC
jgi:hypothetical protein